MLATCFKLFELGVTKDWERLGNNRMQGHLIRNTQCGVHVLQNVLTYVYI